MMAFIQESGGAGRDGGRSTRVVPDLSSDTDSNGDDDTSLQCMTKRKTSAQSL